MLVPKKKMSQLLKEDKSNSDKGQSSVPVTTTTPTAPSAAITAAYNIPANNRATSQANQENPNAPKRKRSAIFIPPVPEESSTNHATEVSICKFKFTGGAKPSL